MDEIVASYPSLFPKDGTPEENESDAGEDSGLAEDAAPVDDFAARWGWISLVDTVAETCRCSWDDVWRKPIIETLNIFAYTKDRNARREDELEKYRKTH